MIEDNKTYLRFHVGGSLSSEHPFYVKRSVDDELYRACKDGEYCTVLETRQVGKTSLLHFVQRRLRNDGVYTVWVDLQKWGGGINEEQFYYALLREIIKKCDLNKNLLNQHFLKSSSEVFLNVQEGFFNGITDILEKIGNPAKNPCKP